MWRYWAIEHFENNCPWGAKTTFHASREVKRPYRINFHNTDRADGIFVLQVSKGADHDEEYTLSRSMVDGRIVAVTSDTLIVAGWVDQQDGYLNGISNEKKDYRPEYRREQWRLSS